MIVVHLQWDDACDPQGNVAHIARHQVAPWEVDEAIFDGPAVWERGRTGRYYALSQTAAGRPLFIVLRYLGHARARVITAREMTDQELRRWRRRRGSL